MSHIYFTSDLHIGHNKEFIYKKRGFDSIEEMNEVIIERINDEVLFEDEVWILGDLIMGDNETNIDFIKRIEGYKHILIGNHDTLRRQDLYKTLNRTEVHGYADIIKYRKDIFYLSHYPVILNNGVEKTPYCLHGHTHSVNPTEYIQFSCINVGLDAWDCRPVQIDTIKELIKKKG